MVYSLLSAAKGSPGFSSQFPLRIILHGFPPRDETNLGSMVFFPAMPPLLLLLPRFSILSALASLLLLLLLPLPWTWTCLAAQNEDLHTTFVFNHFNGSNLILMNDTSLTSEGAVRLTDASDQMLGRALYPLPIRTEAHKSFSTTFVFCAVPTSRSLAAHGMAFMMIPSLASLETAVGVQYLGLLNVTSNGQPYNHLFAVEFDTIQNPEFQDINDNHVGVDINSLHSSESKAAGYWIGNQFHPLDLRSRQNIQAWIDYDHVQDQLNVTVALAGLQKPIRPLISVKALNLSGILLDQAYVGFSAATASFAVERFYILAWSFSTKGMAPALDLSRLPSFLPRKSKYRSASFIAGVAVSAVLLLSACCLAAVLWWKRMKEREVIEEWELEYWPHRFAYEDLRAATEGFGDGRLLGAGGFGKVYKGVLPGSGLQVAVKSINRELTEGMKEFIAEISSMGRLQHRNLVQLRGWGRKNQRLFLVYDYMPNGSLDRLIFGSPRTVLRWPQRYKILKGVAAGLLYLHERWEKRVVHRDIKSSNVLLDSELNARLGDFGLARLYDHTENARTTRVVGTLGYIAPELIQTGKATPGSDVFSFGVVMLEVACGRRPVDQSKDAEESVLVEWLWDLYAKGKLMDAVDPKLGGEFDAGEVERVFHLGLCCSQSEPQGRPTVRQILQILEGEIPAPPPCVPSCSDWSRMLSDSSVSGYGHMTDEMSGGSSSKSRGVSSTTG